MLPIRRSAALVGLKAWAYDRLATMESSSASDLGNVESHLVRFGVTMGYVRRFAVVLLLAFAFSAAPLGALCSACCVNVGSEPTMGAAMPCCDTTCAPKIASARPDKPALTTATVRPERPVLVAVLPSFTTGSNVLSGTRFVFVSPSPPDTPPGALPVLRL